jgi:hypothetical protein
MDSLLDMILRSKNLNAAYSEGGIKHKPNPV